MKQKQTRPLLSDQVDRTEIKLITQELTRILAQQVVGDVVEFGCYVGTTSVYLASCLRESQKELWLYDSFAGLPPKTRPDNSPVGEQFKPGELSASKKQLIHNLKQANVPLPHIIKGWFSQLDDTSLPKLISFAFLDGDYYQSITDSLRLITPRLSRGATIVVDDYSNEALPGVATAVNGWRRHRQASLRVEHSLAILHVT